MEDEETCDEFESVSDSDVDNGPVESVADSDVDNGPGVARDWLLGLLFLFRKGIKEWM